MSDKRYDQAYFDRWYRDSARRVRAPASVARTVAMVVATAEYYLGHRLRNVLDVGCGEGAWRAPLRRLRPELDYLGLDPSEYAVARYGRARNLRLARFGQLEQLRFDRRFDLIVCSDVLHYVPAGELRRGLSGFADLLEGIAFVEVFTAADDPDGDTDGFIARRPDWYRRAFADAGLMACGSHCYLGPRLLRTVAALELAAPSARR
ncbi:MAG TPA: class I SAM-dependent methyltransferase [Dokdonella sp.]|uniref:class I SAM-dependent DNA methyltransferase n=1 Tax=Dokdonella sp. TaxID=2291710 RepID=UPI002B879CF1|nr:class I SAM-dependent methyltransferase [Dokdonella sp.]HUD40679.1 class I SAM-dependent methyltransferase [Dokdonella sp.]